MNATETIAVCLGLTLLVLLIEVLAVRRLRQTTLAQLGAQEPLASDNSSGTASASEWRPHAE
jgi:hypothetical protein